MAKGLFNIGYDFFLALSAGLVSGSRHFAKFGYATDLTAGVEANLWQGPTPLYVFPSDAGESMRIVGGNIADTQLMLVQGLDQDWNEVNIPIALTGTTPVVLPGLLSRINRVINIDSTETIGDALVTNAAGSVVYAVIPAVDQITTQVIFSVPNGYRARLTTPLVTINKSGGVATNVIFRYKRRPFGGVFGTGARFGLNKSGTSAIALPVDGVAPLEPKTDVVLLAESDTNSTDVSARVPFVLYKI